MAHLAVAASSAADVPVSINSDMPAGGGTLGLDVLLNHVVVIDYPRTTFCILAPGDVSTALRRNATWTHATLRAGKLFVDTTIAGETRRDLFFDTGSSRFPIIVEHALWSAMTGWTQPSDTAATVNTTQWGKPKSYIGAHAKQTVRIAGVTLDAPVVFYEEDGFYRDNFGAAGLLGNAPFWNSVVILDLTPRLRFGTLPPVAASRAEKQRFIGGSFETTLVRTPHARPPV